MKQYLGLHLVEQHEQFEVVVLTCCEVERKSKNSQVLHNRSNLLNLRSGLKRYASDITPKWRPRLY